MSHSSCHAKCGAGTAGGASPPARVLRGGGWARLTGFEFPDAIRLEKRISDPGSGRLASAGSNGLMDGEPFLGLLVARAMDGKGHRAGDVAVPARGSP